LLGPPEAEGRGGIFSFNLAGLDGHEIAMDLDESANIAIRSGMHCVHSWFLDKGYEEGSLRASFYFYNTEEEAKAFVDIFGEIHASLF